MNQSTFETDLDVLDAEAAGPNRNAPMPVLGAFCADLGLSVYRTLALLMKRVSELDPRTTRGIWPIGPLHTALSGAYGDRVSADELRILVLEMSLMGLHRAATNAPELSFYEEQKLRADEVEGNAEQALRACLADAKSRWLELHAELGDALAMREDALVRREGQRQAFLRLYGLDYLEEKRQLHRLDVANYALAVLMQQPHISRHDLERQVAEREAELASKLELDQRSLGCAFLPASAIVGTANPVDIDRFKATLKRVWMLLHPDRTSALPLTSKQRVELRRLWDVCQATDVEKLRAAGDTSFARSNAMLEDCLARAQNILEQAGIDIDTALVIRGDSPEARLAWLKHASERLEQEIHLVQGEIGAWKADREMQVMRALCELSEADQQGQRRSMARRANEFAEQSAAIEREIEQRLEDQP